MVDLATVSGGSWLEACLKAVSGARVAVFGDFCLDAYWIIDADESEQSIETGLSVRRVREQRYSLGGAGNVVSNLADLGVTNVHAIGLIGRDMFGAQLLELLKRTNIDTSGLLSGQGDWQTMVYSKPCIGQRELNRLDFGAFNVIAPASMEALVEQLDRVAAEVDVVILNQQVPAGISPPAMIELLNKLIARHQGTQFIVDSRHHAKLYRGASYKLNFREASRLLGQAFPTDEDVSAESARQLAVRLSQCMGKEIFLTRGENGLIAAQGDTCCVIPGIQVLGLTDPVGAGDTALSAIAAALAGGCDIELAAKLANIAASITVRKLGITGTATPQEIRALGSEPDYIYEPELARSVHRAQYLGEGEIEIIRALPAPLRIRHAIFDHDGTISTLRQGWEAIMEPMMVQAILGPRLSDAGDDLYNRVVEQVRQFIDRTCGVQTLVQMQGLRELVLQFACVARDKVLDMHGYKALYNARLLEVVRKRMEKLQRGELDAGDFQIKGAVELLRRLVDGGITVYLASGADVEDVIAEARVLGYAELFGGRIFGAVGDIAKEAKRDVIRQIMREHHLAGPQLVMFGDGPVELREMRKCGGIAVGIASDEHRRFGLNPAKRARLVRGGADLIVPDFLQHERLLGVLGLA